MNQLDNTNFSVKLNIIMGSITILIMVTMAIFFKMNYDANEDFKKHQRTAGITGIVITANSLDDISLSVVARIPGIVTPKRFDKMQQLVTTIVSTLPSDKKKTMSKHIMQVSENQKIPVHSVAIYTNRLSIECDETGCNYTELPVDIP